MTMGKRNSLIFWTAIAVIFLFLNITHAATIGAVTRAQLKGAPAGYGSDMVNFTGKTIAPDTVNAANLVQRIDSIAALRLISGNAGRMAVQVVGYYAAGDGGGGPVRVWKSGQPAGTYIDNGGRVIVPTGGDGSAGWVMEWSGPVSVKWYGAATTTADNSQAFQECVNAHKDVIIPEGYYTIKNTVFVPVGVRIEGQQKSTNIVPAAGGVFTQDAVFIINSADGSTWTMPYPNMNSGGIRHLVFYNGTNNIPGIVGILTFAPTNFYQLSFSYFEQAIKRPSGFFIDSSSFEHIFCDHPLTNTKYQIEILGLGDGLTMKDLHFPYDSTNTRSVLGIKLRGCNGGVVQSVTGGDHLIESATVHLDGWHIEHGQLVCDTANVLISNSSFYPDENRNVIPIIMKNYFDNTTFFQRSGLKMQQVVFVYIEGLAGFKYNGPMVAIDDKSYFESDGVYFKWTANGALSHSQMSGIKVSNIAISTGPYSEGFTANSLWNKYAYAYSVRGRIGANYLPDQNFSREITTTAFPGIAVAPGTGGTGLTLINEQVTFTAPATTYYYTSQLLYDTARLIGRNQTAAEVPIVVSDATKLPLLSADHGSTRPRNCIMRLYRGTAAGVYDYYADVHNIDAAYFYDSGSAVNGIPWVARAASGVSTINSFGSSLTVHGATVDLEANAVPTVGDWTEGDRINRYDGAQDANSMTIFSNLRVSTGSAHANQSDWVYLRASAVSPSL
jgi:hypothetical protein